MRNVPTLPFGLEDVKLIRVLTAILRCLENVLESNTYTVEMVWRVPFKLQVPTSNNQKRMVSPTIVRLARASVSNDLTTPVHFGAVTWEWDGAGSVNITDVDGLVNGVKYRLVFEAVE